MDKGSEGKERRQLQNLKLIVFQEQRVHVSQALESFWVKVGDVTAAQVQQMKCPEVREDCWMEHGNDVVGEV